MWNITAQPSSSGYLTAVIEQMHVLPIVILHGKANFPYQALRNQRKEKRCDWKISYISFGWSLTGIYLPDGQECMLARALCQLFSIWKSLNSAGFTSNLFSSCSFVPAWHTLRLKDNLNNDWGEKELMKHLWLMPSLYFFFPLKQPFSSNQETVFCAL